MQRPNTKYSCTAYCSTSPGEYTWKSFGINIYAIQNDMKGAGVGLFNVPHSSRAQAHGE